MTIHIVGLGQNPENIPDNSRTLIDMAQVLCATQDDLACFDDHPAEKIPLDAPIDEVCAQLSARQSDGLEVVVLTGGDPLFFGIAEALVDRLGADETRVHPGVTIVQTAAARLRIPWQDVRTVSLGGQDDNQPLFSALLQSRWVAVYTDARNIPSAIAQSILDKSGDTHRMWVLEDLEDDRERIDRYTLGEARKKSFSPRSIVMLERVAQPEVPLGLGTPDDLFMRETGLITKGPARAVAIAALRLRPESVLWDLGAGCGALGIEASSVAYNGRVFCVEKNANRVAMIRENIRRTGAYLAEIVHGTMPGCLPDLPDPDRVFIGGGLTQDADTLLGVVCARLRPGGRLVAHAVLLDTLTRARQILDECDWPYSVTLIQAGESAPLAGDLRIAAHNPVFALIADKPDA
ncbi:precorrin-6Y C5,15-methyltransferase (decarboxylating) [Desulfobaculum xiamenense]|uniref:Precorrin-6Y C5,15-methyltransferase (Decarboxylating) n=1 Tax=Desulfobaculum xiamenense TaxID=995050 RepID=A0A846QP87_9BACT|nr:precorrin-6y C5,15-methyltransferase (decarboxylating) subunit CbiE [Desulfobaculum xiamenense]NJB68113.1 precorrin-6Y C5,15-methyltransferase (decarboxylating) [Desulfobaculum xiamenense]